MRETLYAKSEFKGKSKTLIEHNTRDVVESALHLFGNCNEPPTRLGRKFTDLFGVEDVPRFLRNVITAAALHDIGKANEDFQLAIESANLNSGKRRRSAKIFRQRVRHEHVSAVLLMPFAEMIDSATNVDWQPIFSAVVGHHRKTDFWLEDDQDVVFNVESPDFFRLVEYIESVTDLKIRSHQVHTIHEFRFARRVIHG